MRLLLLLLAAVPSLSAGKKTSSSIETLLGWCPGSAPQECRMLCAKPDCGAGSCATRQGSCCNFTCKPRMPSKQMMFCTALLTQSPRNSPRCTHEVEIAVGAAGCTQHVSPSDIRAACGVKTKTASSTASKGGQSAGKRGSPPPLSAVPQARECKDQMLSCPRMAREGRCLHKSIASACCVACTGLLPPMAPCVGSECPVPKLYFSGKANAKNIKVVADPEKRFWSPPRALCQAVMRNIKYSASYPPNPRLGTQQHLEPKLRIATLQGALVPGGVVPLGKPGVYRLTYSCTAVGPLGHGKAVPIVKTVTVQDQTPPSVVPNLVNGQMNLKLELGTPYRDPGASCMDPLSGNRVKATVGLPMWGWDRDVGTHRIVYTCKKANGAVDTVIRLVKVVDTTPPVLKIDCKDCTRLGHEVRVPFGSKTFSMPRVTCQDPHVGDVSGSVRVSVKRDKSAVPERAGALWWRERPGLYGARYECIDAAGNVAAPALVLFNVVVQPGGPQPKRPRAPTPAPRWPGCTADCLNSCARMALDGRCVAASVRRCCCNSCSKHWSQLHPTLLQGRTPSQRKQIATTPKSKQRRCSLPPTPEHGNSTITGLFVSATAQFACNPGYIMSGPKRRTCMLTGKWSGADTFCFRDPCLQQPAFNKDGVGNVKRTYLPDNSVEVTVYCSVPRVNFGGSTWRCTRGANGKAAWIGGKPPQCSMTCPRLPSVVPHAEVSNWTPLAREGSRVVVSCHSGYHLPDGTQMVSILCQRDGTWTKPPHSMPRCKVAQCGKPPRVAHSSISTSCTHFGCRAVYRCDDTVTRVGLSEATCLSTGKWSPPPECVTLRPCRSITCSVHDRRLKGPGRHKHARMVVRHPTTGKRERPGTRHVCRVGGLIAGLEGCTCLCYTPELQLMPAAVVPVYP